MEPDAVAAATDFWGVVVPAYVGAIGGIISAVVGAVALIISLRNRGGVRVLAQGLNDQGGQAIEYEGASAPGEPREFLTWRIEHDGRSRYNLTNVSWTRTARLVIAEDITADGDGAFQMLVDLPVEIGPQASVPFIIEKSLVSPAVTAIRLVWIDEQGFDQTQTLYR